MNGDTYSCNSLERQGELLLQKMCMAMNNYSSLDANSTAAAPSYSFHLTRPTPSTKKCTSSEEVTIDDCSSEMPPKACSSGSASPSGTTRSLSSDDLTCHDFLTTEPYTGGHQVSCNTSGSSTEPRPDDLKRNDLSSSSILDLLLDNNDMISNEAERSASSMKNTFPKDTLPIDPQKDQEQTVLQERQLGQSQQMKQLLLQ